MGSAAVRTLAATKKAPPLSRGRFALGRRALAGRKGLGSCACGSHGGVCLKGGLMAVEHLALEALTRAAGVPENQRAGDED